MVRTLEWDRTSWILTQLLPNCMTFWASVSCRKAWHNYRALQRVISGSSKIILKNSSQVWLWRKGRWEKMEEREKRTRLEGWSRRKWKNPWYNLANFYFFPEKKKDIFMHLKNFEALWQQRCRPVGLRSWLIAWCAMWSDWSLLAQSEGFTDSCSGQTLKPNCLHLIARVCNDLLELAKNGRITIVGRKDSVQLLEEFFRTDGFPIC